MPTAASQSDEAANPPNVKSTVLGTSPENALAEAGEHLAGAVGGPPGGGAGGGGASAGHQHRTCSEAGEAAPGGRWVLPTLAEGSGLQGRRLPRAGEALAEDGGEDAARLTRSAQQGGRKGKER